MLLQQRESLSHYHLNYEISNLKIKILREMFIIETLKRHDLLKEGKKKNDL